MKHSRGFSMVEVLVSVVVLSVALLGTAGLTAASLKSTNESYFRSQATVLADDILDRMRSNVVVARGGTYNVTDYDPPTVTAGGGLALFDVNEWLDNLATTLPKGSGNIAVNNSVATVTIVWGGDDDDDDDDGDERQVFTTVSRL